VLDNNKKIDAIKNNETMKLKIK